MCLIIYRTATAKGTITRAWLEASRDNGNNDAFGLMYAEQGELVTWKSQHAEGFEQLCNYVEVIQKTKHVPLLVHMRFATHGDASYANAHPIPVVEGLSAMMHNGILGQYTKVTSPHSDTALLAKELRQLPRRWHHNPTLCRLVEEHIGLGNKLAVLDRFGYVRLFNEKAGRWIDGVWLSNDSYLERDWSAWYASSYMMGQGRTWKGKTPSTITTTTTTTTTTPLLPRRAQTAATKAQWIGADDVSDDVAAIACTSGLIVCPACYDDDDDVQFGRVLLASEVSIADQCALCGDYLVEYEEVEGFDEDDEDEDEDEDAIRLATPKEVEEILHCTTDADFNAVLAQVAKEMTQGGPVTAEAILAEAHERFYLNEEGCYDGN